MPKIRMEAVRLVKYRGWSTRKVARHFGFTQSAIVKWCAKDPTGGWWRIPTRSSRPHHHPKQLQRGIIEKIIAIRERTKRTSEVVYQELANQEITVSLNSVRRTIDRAGLMKKRSPWKRYHPPVPRPIVEKPGDLVQIDTIHRMIDDKKRLYIFVLLDVCSRWAYARAYARMNGRTTLRFIAEAQRNAPFHFVMLQSDHGPEFGRWFVAQVRKKHRYTLIGKPNDNAHIERFNRTLQEECVDAMPADVRKINCALRKYLRYYNHERLHLGIALRTPIQIVSKRFQAIG
ncbi:MAG: DDE-type integrase/transposase/recombinase [Patescibacteria group bacterium]|nr:DDE-type integrase/transposase/recombinase [Patescibacteria group bacterium]